MVYCKACQTYASWFDTIYLHGWIDDAWIDEKSVWLCVLVQTSSEFFNPPSK